MVSVSRDAPSSPPKSTAQEGAELIGSIIGKTLYILQPFVVLVNWQICMGLFAYFFPAAVEQWTAYVHVPWPLFALVCGIIRLWSIEFRPRV